MRGRLVSLATAALFATACTQTIHTRVPYEGNPRRADAETCVHRCHDRLLTRHSDTYYECLAQCPGAERATGACAEEDQPPQAYCAELATLSARRLLVTVGWIAGIVVVSLVVIFAVGGAP